MPRWLLTLLLLAAPAWADEAAVPPSPAMSVAGLPIVPIWAEHGERGAPETFQVVAPDARPARPDAPDALWRAFDAADWPELWRRALPGASEGDVAAMLLAGWAGLRVKGHEAEGIRMLTGAAGGGSGFAAFELGRAHLYGIGVQRDDAAAVRWFTRAGDLGLVFGPAVLVLLQESWETGAPALDGVSHATAAEWARRAGAAGHAVSSRTMAYNFHAGEGVRQDEAESLRWWRRAAEQGLAEAQAYMARRYQFGTGVAPDPDEAVRWHVRAAWGYLARPLGKAIWAGTEMTEIEALDPDNPALPALTARIKAVFAGQ